MSRSRPWVDEDGACHWFDVRSPAKVRHLELLSDVEEIDLDDILEENLSQKQVLYRLHKASNLIPQGVLDKRRERREQAQRQPACRICPSHGWICEGRITRHHFVPRWLMRELGNYEAYASRSFCTIPVCVGRHRDLHERGEFAYDRDKSIVRYLTESERRLAEKMLVEIKAQRPAIFTLIEGGDSAAYEGQLIEDFSKGRFRVGAECDSIAVGTPRRSAQAGG